MTWPTMIVLIVLIVVVGGIVREQRKSAGRSAPDKAEKAALEREVVELRQRIATLEKIATDKSRRLSREIDALDEEKKGE